MSTLLLTLPTAHAGPTADYSYTLTSDGQTALQHASSPAALLPAATGPGAEVVAVVPVQLLSWQQVQLPPGLPLQVGGPSPRLRAALEGLLEDRLLDDPSHLHFALQPSPQAGTALWVAVCPKAWLAGHLQALEAAGRPVSRVVPAFAPAALGAETTPQLFALGTPETALLVLAPAGVDQGVLALPLGPSALALANAQGLPLADLVVYAEPAVAAQAEQLLGRPVALTTPSTLAMQAARSEWDLAQFDLASSGRSRALRRAGSTAQRLLHGPAWRAARWGAGALVAAHLLGVNLWAWQEEKALAAKQAAVRTTLTQTFPHIQVVVDAPVQMQREVAQLRQANGSTSARDLEAMLAAAGTALPPGQQPSTLVYTPGELRLGGLNLSPDLLESLQSRLQASGYQTRSEDGNLLLRTGATP